MNTTTKLMTLLLAMLASINVGAQGTTYEYVPFVREGVKWVCFYDNYDITEEQETRIQYFSFEMKGDTIFNGKHYKPVVLYKLNDDGNEIVQDFTPVYLREENKVVFAIHPDGKWYCQCPVGFFSYVVSWNFNEDVSNEEFVLYDFNDPNSLYQINLLGDNNFTFLGTDTVAIGNHLSKRYTYNGFFDTNDVVIEGIGCDGYYGMPLFYFPMPITGVQDMYGLSHVIEDGTIIYKGRDYKEPEPEEYEYLPFVREGVKWVYSIQDYHYEMDYETNPARGDNKVYRTLEIKGDTIINGKTYKAMHMCTDDVYSEPKDVVPIYLREENKMVYGIVPDGKHYDDATLGHMAIYSGEEFLLYDFQDPVTYWNNLLDDDWLNIPLQMDTIEVGGHYVKRLFDERQEGDYFQIIEGIGAMGMNSYPLAFVMPVCTGVHCTEYYSLEKVVENGEVIYPQNYVEDRYLPVIREGVKWVNVHVVINDGDTTKNYYTYEFKGNYPETDSYNRVFKAVYSKNCDANGAGYGEERLVAGLREDEACILSFRNEPLGWMTNLINFYTYQGNDDVRLLHENLEGMWDIDYYINHQAYPHMNLLNTDNFVKADPIEIDGYRCSRIAYIGEQGDTLAYLVEGIGFDSRDFGDLLTPLTRYPEADCGECYQEYCGLSHVIKDGKIIYKGMCYDPNVEPVIPGDANGDGEITIADANSVIDIVIMGGNASHPRMPAIDMNDDGEVTIADVNVIIDIILNNNLIY